MELEQNQAALILEASDEGDITVNVALPDPDSLAGALCQIIARKMAEDEEFQEELIAALAEDQ